MSRCPSCSPPVQPAILGASCFTAWRAQPGPEQAGRCPAQVRLPAAGPSRGQWHIPFVSPSYLRDRMLNQSLKDQVVRHVLPSCPDAGTIRGRRVEHGPQGPCCSARNAVPGVPGHPTIGMSHHGLQVLYTLMNGRTGRASGHTLDRHGGRAAWGRSATVQPETFTPLGQFDVVGFTLQYEIAATCVDMLDLGASRCMPSSGHCERRW
jgi:hypothetical protein